MLPAFTFGFAKVPQDLARTAVATASSFYNVAPFEIAFLPSNAIDGDDATAWSSLGEGCAAKLFLTLDKATEVQTVCARSRDMVESTEVLTDDSVIESFDVRADGVFVRTCALPDWRQVYCCTLDAPVHAKTVSLEAKTCRTRQGGPSNTGFRTVQLFPPEADDGAVSNTSVVGNRNVVSGASSNVNALGSDMASSSSTDSTLVGHESRMLSSDETSLVGTEHDVRLSDRAVAIGHMVKIDDADSAVAIGSHLNVTVPSSIVVGQYNAPLATTAKFVVAAGSAESPRNLLEVHTDGHLVNAHVKSLEDRIASLESKLEQALSSCTSPECGDIRTAYIAIGCCPASR